MVTEQRMPSTNEGSSNLFLLHRAVKAVNSESALKITRLPEWPVTAWRTSDENIFKMAVMCMASNFV